MHAIRSARVVRELLQDRDLQRAIEAISLDRWDLASYSSILAQDLLELEDSAHRNKLPLSHRIQKQQQTQQQQEQQQMQQQGPGYSIVKPYNTIINWKKLLANIPENALIIGGAASASWMMIVAALVLVRKMLDMTAIELTQEQATVMLVLAAAFGSDRAVPETALKIMIDKHLEQARLPIMSDTAFHRAVDDLHRLRSVELAGGQIRLVEKVPVTLVEHIWVETR